MNTLKLHATALASGFTALRTLSRALPAPAPVRAAVVGIAALGLWKLYGDARRTGQLARFGDLAHAAVGPATGVASRASGAARGAAAGAAAGAANDPAQAARADAVGPSPVSAANDWRAELARNRARTEAERAVADARDGRRFKDIN